jgi:hypothetical protein
MALLIINKMSSSGVKRKNSNFPPFQHFLEASRMARGFSVLYCRQYIHMYIHTVLFILYIHENGKTVVNLNTGEYIMYEQRAGSLAFPTVHPQNVRFQNVQFQYARFQNVKFTKRQIYKTSSFKTSGYKTSIEIKASKRPVFKLVILNKQKL